MKRYASHFLFLPGHGYLKQYVVEIGEGQCVSRIFPLTEEVENTEWLPSHSFAYGGGNRLSSF